MSADQSSTNPSSSHTPSAQPPKDQVQTIITDRGVDVPPKVVQQKQIGKYLVQVIREKCISAGSCVAIAPNVSALDEEGIAVILSQDGDDDDTKLLAAQSCPTAAIIVTDTEAGKQVWPPIFEEEN